MLRKLILARKEFQSGQAMVEFALGAGLLLFMVFATIEASRYGSLKLRIASTTRESARLFIASEIEPASYATNAAEYTSNAAALAPVISNLVYVPIQDMVAPADLQNKGKVIISILRRYDHPTGTPPVSNATTNDATDDKVLVEYQFIYPSSTSFTNWPSQIASVTAGYTNVFTNILPVSALSIDERTVAVEIYHKVEIFEPMAVLNWTKFEYVYDMAIY